MNKRTLLITVLGGGLLFTAALIVAVFSYGGIGQLVAAVNGEAVYISPQTLDLGSFRPGEETVAIFKMTNLSSQEMSVVGERSSCNCAFSEQIPIKAAQGKTVDLKIKVHLPSYDNSYDQTVTFMVAEPRKLAMHPVRIIATIPNPLQRPADAAVEP